MSHADSGAAGAEMKQETAPMLGDTRVREVQETARRCGYAAGSPAFGVGVVPALRVCSAVVLFLMAVMTDRNEVDVRRSVCVDVITLICVLRELFQLVDVMHQLRGRILPAAFAEITLIMLLTLYTLRQHTPAPLLVKFAFSALLYQLSYIFRRVHPHFPQNAQNKKPPKAAASCCAISGRFLRLPRDSPAVRQMSRRRS